MKRTILLALLSVIMVFLVFGASYSDQLLQRIEVEPSYDFGFTSSAVSSYSDLADKSLSGTTKAIDVYTTFANTPIVRTEDFYVSLVTNSSSNVKLTTTVQPLKNSDESASINAYLFVDNNTLGQNSFEINSSIVTTDLKVINKRTYVYILQNDIVVMDSYTGNVTVSYTPEE